METITLLADLRGHSPNELQTLVVKGDELTGDGFISGQQLCCLPVTDIAALQDGNQIVGRDGNTVFIRCYFSHDENCVRLEHRFLSVPPLYFRKNKPGLEILYRLVQLTQKESYHEN